MGKHLIPLLLDKEAFVRGLTTTALGKLKYQPATEAIILLLTDDEHIYSSSSETVRDAAVKALKCIGTSDALNALTAIDS
jgi:HEAT repeat protein